MAGHQLGTPASALPRGPGLHRHPSLRHIQPDLVTPDNHFFYQPPGPDLSHGGPIASSSGEVYRIAPPPLSASSPESDMHAASAASSGSVKYTRTGRVSKAAKGQRVHHCDECGKTYTRAEHLRRHQQNHKPGAFPCDFPDCGRSFYREDLLARHKIRHNEFDEGNDPLPSFSGRPSTTSSPLVNHGFGGSMASVYHTFPNQASVGSNELHSNGSSANHSPTHTRTSIKEQVPTNDLYQAPATLTVSPNGLNQHFPVAAPTWPAQIPHSTGSMASSSNGAFYDPNVPYLYSGGRHASVASMMGHAHIHNSQPPTPTGSTNVHIPSTVPPTQSLPTYPMRASSSSEHHVRSDSIVGTGSQLLGSQRPTPPPSHNASRNRSIEERDFVEQVDLALMVKLSEDASEAQYIEAYWQYTHPLLPVVHRPSTDLQNTSPLLKTAMLALGANSLKKQTAMENARVMHEQSLKVLKTRTTQPGQSLRVTDMQAIILIETFAVFKARRPAQQLSSWFIESYRQLSTDPEAMNTVRTHATNGPSTGTAIPQQIKQNLLLACYTLDLLHSTLFGRRRTPDIPALGAQLPFPRSLIPSEQAFDNVPYPGTSGGAEPWERLWQAVGGALHEHTISLDSFQSLLVMCYINDPANKPYIYGYMDKVKPMSLTSLRQTVEQSPRCKMTWHILMLCRNTPIRALLATAGESWMLTEKLASQEDFAAEQARTRQWAKGLPGPFDENQYADKQATIERAFLHAKQILELHRMDSRTGLPFQEWAIYLAALVVWARGYINSTQVRQASTMLNMAVTDPPGERGQLSEREMEQSMVGLGNSGPGVVLPWTLTRGVLLWTKGQIEKVDVPHNCGLTNLAQDILMKLALRGNDDGWFG